MSSTYSSIIGNIWPPPNQETMERLQRLKELQEMRQSRDSRATRTNLREQPSTTDISSSRTSRRQLLSSYRQPTSRLGDRREEIRSRNVERTSSFLDKSHDNLNEPVDYGGAKPKRLSYSKTFTENDNSRSEILRELRENAVRQQGKRRERKTSNGSDTSEEQSPLFSTRRNALEEVKTVEETNENQESCSLANDVETEVKKQDMSAESENLDPNEDFEHFKQSLYGSRSLDTRSEFDSSSLKPFSLNESPNAANIDINKFGFSDTIEWSTFPKKDYSEIPRSEKTNIKGTYSVREGFKRIDEVFDSNPTRSSTSLTSDSKKIRSRMGKTAETDREKNDSIQRHDMLGNSYSSNSEEVSAIVTDKNSHEKSAENTSLSKSAGKGLDDEKTKEPNSHEPQSDYLAASTKSNRVLIFDGESMVVEGENDNKETILNSVDLDANDQGTDVLQESVANEAMNASEEITITHSQLNETDKGHVDTVDDVETKDPGPVIIGSFSSNDIDVEANPNESESVLTENDSIFDYKRKFQNIDSYFDSMESISRDQYTRQYRRETPTYSRTKSMPYGNTGRSNRFSSLPSTVDERISEFRARYTLRDTDTTSDAPSTYFSNVGRSYDYSSSLSDRSRSYLTESHSTVGTSDNSRRNNESVLSRIMNRSFRTIDEYFGPQKDEVILKRRTSRAAKTEKITPEAGEDTVLKEINKAVKGSEVNADTSEREPNNTENSTSLELGKTEIQSGSTLKSDITERESNFIEDIESETVTEGTGTIDDSSEQMDGIVETSIVHSTKEADVNVDGFSDEEGDEQTEVVEIEEIKQETYTVECGSYVHLDPDTVPVVQSNIENKSGDKESSHMTEAKVKVEVSAENENVQTGQKLQTLNDVENGGKLTSDVDADSKNSFKDKSKKKDKRKKAKKKKDQSSKDNTFKNSNEDNGKVENGLHKVDDKSLDVESSVTSESDTISEKSARSLSDVSSPSKSSSKLRKFFDGIMSAIDHRSDKTSIATEDLLSLESQEGVSHDQISHDTSLKASESSEEHVKSNSSNGDITGLSDIVHEEHYAKFENEDLPSRSEDGGSKNSPLPDEASATSAEADTFETASETTESGEFFETVPAELLGLFTYKGESNSSVERKEKFVYLCPSTKIRKKKIKMKSLLGTSVIKKQAKMREKQRLGQVKAWMENNIFPVEDETEATKLISTKSNSSMQDSAFSVESVIDDTESKRSILSQAPSTSKNPSFQTVTSQGDTISKSLISCTTQTDLQQSIRKSSTTQTLLKTWNTGVQVETSVLNRGTQTLAELICPCCSHTIDIAAALLQASESKKVDITKSPRSYNKISDNLSYEINDLVSKEQVGSISSNTHVSLPVPSQCVSSTNASKESSNKTSPSISPEKINPSSPSKQIPVPPPRNVKSPKSENKTTVKSRREKVADVKEMLYNSDISKNKSAKMTKKPPTPAKTKNTDDSKERLKSITSENERESLSRTGNRKTKSREPSEDRSSCAGSENNGDMPSYMQPTRSSYRKSSKSRENSAERIIDGIEGKSALDQKKHKRLNSQKKVQSRESSADRSEFGDKDSENRIDGLPSFMQPTRSSSRKKLDAFLSSKDEKSKKQVTQSNSNSGNEDETQEHIMSVNENPFIRNDLKKGGSTKKTKESGLSVWERLGPTKRQVTEGKGKWYRKEPIADSNNSNSKKTKGRSPKKSRALSLTAIDMISNTSSKNPGSDDKDEEYNPESKSKSLVTEIDIETEPDHVTGNDIVKKEININGHTNENESDTKLVFESNAISDTSADDETKNASPHSDREKEEFNHLEPGENEEGSVELSAEEQALAQEHRGVKEAEDDEKAPVRINFSSWDPSKLLKDLYSVRLMSDTTEDISDKFIAMEGLMEKLPMNKKKATLLKTWKRRFFRAKDGWLHYFETGSRDKPSDSLQLMGGKVDDLGNRILGIDDGRGRYLMVRCPTDKEYGQWKLALESQTADNVKATYVRPALILPQHPEKNIVIIDIGSSAIRAGILGEQATLPKLFFPSTVARNKKTGELMTGIKAYTPEVRQQSELRKPVYPTEKVDKFGIDIETIDVVFKKIFTELGVDSTKFLVMISTPQNLGDKVRAGLMTILIDQFHVKGVCMSMQALLALYSYNATSGIIVDIGERMEILPIYDGYVIEGGVSRQSYGGQKVAESLKHSLEKYKLSTPIQQLLVRYVMEQSCYVTSDYKDTLKKCEENPDNYKTMISLSNYDLPEGADITVTHDYSCFKSPEGFFNTDLWGMDYPCVHKLVFKAIQSCPMDGRKRMYRAVYLSGGVTLLPGFAERLQLELLKLAPPSVLVEVHSSPNRYHSAFIGACSLANMEQFQQICISSEEWKKDRVKAFKKWNMTS